MIKHRRTPSIEQGATISFDMVFKEEKDDPLFSWRKSHLVSSGNMEVSYAHIVS
jgi:hypothetical protein